MNTEAVNAYLRSQGIDPDKVIVDPNTGEVTDRLEPAKTAESTSTAFGAGGRALAHGIIPAAAGVAGAGLAAAAMPVTGGLSGFAIPLLAGLGASAGTAAIQEKLLPDEAKARLAKDVEEHPIAATVGGAAAQLPFMRPSLNTVRQAGAGVRSLLSGAGASQVRPEQLAALSNIAAGGAIGGGIQAGRDALHGEFNPTEIAKATAEGLIFHEPTALGRTVSFRQFHQTPEFKPDEWSGVDMNTAGQKSPSTLAREQEVVALEKFRPLSYALDKAEIPYDPTVPGIDAAVSKLKPFRDSTVLGTAKSKAEELVTKLTAERDQWKATHPEATAAVEAKLAKAQADLDFYNKVPKFYEVFNDQLAGLDPKSPQNIAKMTKFAEQQGQTRAEAMPGKEEEAKIEATAKGIREESDRITAEREAEAKRIAEEQADPKWSKTGGARFQPVVDDTIPPAPSSERVRGSNWDEAATAVGKRFGANIEHVPEVVVETIGPDGKKTTRYRSASADSLANPADQALIKISDAAGLDAAPHELWHTIVDRFRKGTPSEKRFVERTVESALSSHPELAEEHAQRMYGKSLKDLTPDERFEVGHEVSTQKIGEHLVSRLRGDDSFFSDVGAYLSNKFGRASDAQLTRLASNIIRRGKGFETTGNAAPNAAAAGARFQPLGEDKPNPILNPQTRTDDFRNFFGNWDRIQELNKAQQESFDPQRQKEIYRLLSRRSAVVNEDGSPMVVYHGTKRGGFNTFDTAHTPEMGPHFGTPAQSGEFVTSPRLYKEINNEADKTLAYERTMLRENANVQYPVFLNIRKPLETPDLFAHSPMKFANWAEANDILQPAQHKAIEQAVTEGRLKDGWRMIKEELTMRGYDGIKYVNTAEGDVGEPHNVAWIAFHPEQQVKSAIGNKGTFDPKNPDIRYQPLGPTSDRFTNESPERSKNPFASPVEALRRTSSPDNRAFADAAEKLHNDERVLNGRFTNALQKVWLDLGKENAAKAWEHGHDEMRAGRVLPTTPEIRSALDTYRGILRAMHENQRAAGHTNVLGEEVSDNPLYMPGVESNAARQILAERVGSADFNTLKADFIKAQEDAGFSSEEAEALFEKKRSGLLGSDDLSKNFSFKAVDLPSGVKLPASWTEADPVAATRKYGNRWSKARAWWDVVQSDPAQMKRLGSTTFKHGEAIPDDTVAENISANPNVKDILAAYARGMKVSTEPVIPAIGRLLNSLILAGPTTKLTDIGTTLFKGMAYAPAGSQLKVIAHALKNWRQSMENSYTQGLNKRGDSVVMSQMLGAGEHVANRLDSLTEGIVKWTGAEAMEKTSRGLAQGIGEFIAEAQRGLAASGDRRAQQFLAKLGADHATASIPELGTRIGQLLQGKYDITNTARWLHDSPLAPFMSMMRWSVEQTNNFNRFVLEPLVKHKDPVPLFAHLIAGAAGGVVLNQVREWLSGHKDQLASWGELSKNLDAPGAKKELAMKLIAALQVTGTAGIISEMVKQGADVASGQMPQGFHYPVIDTAGDIGLRLAGLADAMRSGEDPVKYLTKFTIDVTRHNIQVARLAIDAAGKAGIGPTADDSAERDAKRDLRVFNRLKDYPANQSVPLVPSYSNLTEKSLDRETDMHKAAGIAQELTHRAFARFAETHDMVELTSALRKIKTAPDTAVPSPDRDPVKFQRYIKYIADTQGQAAADELVKQTFRGKAMRAAKASMVPSIGGR